MAQTLLVPRLHAKSFGRRDEVRTLPNFRVETVALEKDAVVVQPQNRDIPEYGVPACAPAN